MTDSSRRPTTGPPPIHYGTSSDNMLPAIKPNRTDLGRTKRTSTEKETRQGESVMAQNERTPILMQPAEDRRPNGSWRLKPPKGTAVAIMRAATWMTVTGKETWRDKTGQMRAPPKIISGNSLPSPKTAAKPSALRPRNWKWCSSPTRVTSESLMIPRRSLDCSGYYFTQRTQTGPKWC